MTNPSQGEALAPLEGRELTLRFDMEAAACLEAAELGDLRINEVLAEMTGPVLPGDTKPSFRRPRLATQVALFYAATRFHHRDITLERATALMVDSASNGALFWPLMRALARFLGNDDDEAAAGDEGGGADADANPPQSAPGISSDSSSDGAPPDSTQGNSGAKPPEVTGGP